MGDAMSLTPEKVAFIKGSPAKELSQPPEKKPAPVEKSIELETPAVETNHESPRSQRRRGRGRSSAQQQPNEILDQILVPVTIRLQHRTAQALKRAHLEQRLSHAKPDTQQEIVEAALFDWLSKAGFLD